jgi:hypothetical protein
VTAERIKAAVRRLTGFEARVAPGKVEIAYDGEHALAELAEVLERVSADARPALN